MAYGRVIMRKKDATRVETAKTLWQAVKTARTWCIKGGYRSAEIVRDRDNRHIMTYWFDGQLHFTRY